MIVFIMQTSNWRPLRFAVRLLPVAATVVALGVAGRAQTAPARDPASAQPQSVEQGPVFRVGVTLVTTDVIVRDANGQFIPDLDTEDLVVYEDGVVQEIASLVLVHGGRVYNQLLPPAPVQEGIILPVHRPVSDTAGRVFILFIDDLHLETGLTPQIRRVFKQIADTLIHEGDMFGIISSGPSAINVDMTYDRSLLYSAMEKITGDGFSARQLVTEMQAGQGGPMELRWRVHKTFKIARQIAANLERLEHRRKSFIYLSHGYDFNPYQMERLRRLEGPASQLGDLLQEAGDDAEGTVEYADSISIPNPQRLRELQQMAEPASNFSVMDLAMELADLAQAANRANASFYAIDPRGLVAGADLDFDVSMPDWNKHLSQTQFTMRTLAEMTGGIAVVNTNNFRDALQRIDAETSDYYILGFYSNNSDPTVRTRRLRVEVNRPGASVRHRTHYTFADPLYESGIQ